MTYRFISRVWDREVYRDLFHEYGIVRGTTSYYTSMGLCGSWRCHVHQRFGHRKGVLFRRSGLRTRDLLFDKFSGEITKDMVGHIDRE